MHHTRILRRNWASSHQPSLMAHPASEETTRSTESPAPVTADMRRTTKLANAAAGAPKYAPLSLQKVARDQITIQIESCSQVQPTVCVYGRSIATNSPIPTKPVTSVEIRPVRLRRIHSSCPSPCAKRASWRTPRTQRVHLLRYLFLVEHTFSESHRHIEHRHHLHDLGLAHAHSVNAAHRTRPRSIRCRLVSRLGRCLRQCRRRRKRACVRLAKPRALDHHLRDWDSTRRDRITSRHQHVDIFQGDFDTQRAGRPSTQDRLQPMGRQLPGHLSPRVRLGADLGRQGTRIAHS